MAVKAASRLVSRAMRGTIRETISPDTGRRDGHSLEEAGKVSRQFGQKLHHSVNAYIGAVDEFGAPDNTVDRWRLQLGRHDRDLKPANDRRKV